MASKRIIISGGGTGGHIYPAIAIATALREIAPDTELLFVGANGRMEMEKVPQAGFPILGLDIAGINRSNLLSNIGFPLKFVKSLQSARKIIRDFQPDAAVGVGGYASGPTLLAAGWAGVPYLIQEQNSHAGITNRWLGRNAQKICVAYPGMEAFFAKDKLLLTGNPVRTDIGTVKNTDPAVWQYFQGLTPGVPTLLIIGGSQGARTLNESISGGLDALLSAGIQVIWQTGLPFAEQAAERVKNKVGVWTAPFISAMPLAYAAATVVASRAGALSISELCLAGKPSVFVPLPSAAEDHQTRNAQTLVEERAGILVSDASARENLVPTLLGLFDDTSQQNDLTKNILTLARPSAAMTIAREVLNLCVSR